MTEIQTATDPLTLAEAKLAEFQAHLAVARETVAANRKKAAEIAFDAENGDSASRRLAEKLLADNLRLESDIEYIKGPAVAEATLGVDAARNAIAEEAQRSNAEKSRALIVRFKEACERHALRPTDESGQEVRKIAREVRALSAPMTTDEMIASGLRHMMNASLTLGNSQDGRLVHAQFSPMSSTERHIVASLPARWAAPVEHWAATILDAPEKAGRAA
jgi:hypothetical protein